MNWKYRQNPIAIKTTLQFCISLGRLRASVDVGEGGVRRYAFGLIKRTIMLENV